MSHETKESLPLELHEGRRLVFVVLQGTLEWTCNGSPPVLPGVSRGCIKLLSLERTAMAPKRTKMGL